MDVTIKKGGNELAVRIPEKITERAGLKIGGEIDIEAVDNLIKMSTRE